MGSEVVDEGTKRTGRKPNARHPQVIRGALEENARMLLSIPAAEGIGARIIELLDEQDRAKGKDNGK